MVTFTCEEALQEIGIGMFQKKVIFVFGMLYVADGAEFMIISLLGSWIKCALKVHEIGAAMMNASVFIGLVVGSPLQGYLIDIFGRKRVLVLFMGMLAVMSTLFALSPTYKWVTFLRFAVGIFLGPKAITYAVEFFPINGRKYVLFIKTFWSIGTFVIMGCAYVVMMYATWRTLMLIVAAIPMICTYLIVLYIPESPRYLIIKGRLREARGILERIAKENRTALPRGHLVGETTKTTKTTIILFFLWTTAAFLYYGISILSVTYMLKKGTFIEDNPEFQCSSCTPITNTYYILQMIFAVADLIGNLLVIFMLDCAGRKATFMVIRVLTLVSILYLYIVSFGPVVSLTLFVSKIGVAGILSALMQYTVEVYPTVIRGTGAGFTSNGYSFGAALTPFVVEVLIYTSLPWTLGIYVMVSACSLFACWSLRTETGGKELKDY